MNDEDFDLDSYLDEIASDLAEDEKRHKRWKESTARALLQSVENLGRFAFEKASEHKNSVLLFDLADYETNVVLIADLPRLFTMARRGQGLVPDAVFCEEDFSQLNELKELTHGKTSLIPRHFAVPVFIAPPLLHTDQSTAWICVCVWDSHMSDPWSNLPLIEP